MTTKQLTSWMLACLVASVGLGGCSSQSLGYLGYLLAPAQKPIKVAAEYEGLDGKTVAIVVYADQKAQYEYPYARLELSAAIAADLKEHIQKVNVVDPRRVVKYQDEKLHWEAMDKTKLGQSFGADFVLYVIVDLYTMREPGSEGLYRGQISAQAKLYDVKLPESEAVVWSGEDFNVLFPEKGPVGELGESDAKIRYATEKLFALELVRKFYKHEIPRTEE